MSTHLADRIIHALRHAPAGLTGSDLKRMVYADRRLPAGPDKVIHQTILRMRRRGTDVGFNGQVYRLPDGFDATEASLPNGGPRRAVSRAEEVVALLREYEDIGLTALDLADEMGPTSNGRPVLTEQVHAILRREVPRIAAIERVGNSYRLTCNPREARACNER